MKERRAILILGCDEASTGVMRLCLAPRGLDMMLVGSPTALVRDVMSCAPVAIVVGMSHEGDLESIEMAHAVDRSLPVIAIAKEDSIELERRAREARIFYYVVEPLLENEFAAVIDDVLRYAMDHGTGS